jgi:hypothetical protein
MLSVIAAIILVIVIIICINKKGNNVLESIIPEENKKPKLTIVDENSNSRPYAVMINNHPSARVHHAGLQDAYEIYEMIVEGGMTRYLAVFKDQSTAKIGSVRSARPYYLDYVLENDAIYVHWGWSPQAESDISTLGINNINGLTWEGTYFYRDKSLNVSLEHTGFTTMDMLKSATTKMNYRNTTSKKLLLNYTTDTVDLSNKENSEKADTVVIRYSNSVEDKYTYDSTNNYYLRYINDKAHTDDITKNQYHFKNIITYQVDNDTITEDEKGRQTLYNVGSGEGYYITNGYAVKIKWSKASREAQTKYTYLDGTEINVSDGNTFIQIQPKGEDLTIKGNE